MRRVSSCAMVFVAALVLSGGCDAVEAGGDAGIYDQEDAGSCEVGMVSSGSLGGLITEDDRTCDIDADCMIFDHACCDCANWGAKGAIRAEAESTVEDRRQQVCIGPCSPAASWDETCRAAAAVCRQGRCELWGPRGSLLETMCR